MKQRKKVHRQAQARSHGYREVNEQQGRVRVDADSDEQAAVGRARYFLVYIDTWESASSLPSWQVRVMPIRRSLLRASPESAHQPAIPTLVSSLPSGGEYDRLENHIYTIEIHDPSAAPQGPTFNWSTDTASTPSYPKPRRVHEGIPLVTDEFITLEDGVSIIFPGTYNYRTGDYWLIPARKPQNASWPSGNVLHHYRPLATLRISRGEVRLLGA